MPNTAPALNVLQEGDAGKPQPFTITIISNPSLERPLGSGNFVADSITTDQQAFDACAQYIKNALLGRLPGQRELFLADPAIGPCIRIVSLFVTGLNLEDANSLVGEQADLLVARRNVFNGFLIRYRLQADVAYAVSQSEINTRASAWYTSDDDTRPGVAYSLDGTTLYHRYYNLIPGMVAIHSSSSSLTALHEFGHALSSYTNGKIVDLYVDDGTGVNNKTGRPIPAQFAVYNNSTYASDSIRDGLGYPAGWQSYHCELIDPALPAIMDDYWQAPDGVPEHCQHDRITRQFLIDRVLAKISR